MPKQISRLNTNLESILSFKMSVKCFEQFLETLGPVPPRLLQFVITVDKQTRAMAAAGESSDVGGAVKEIFDKYIAPEGSHCIELEEGVRTAVEAEMTKAPTSMKCFRPARKHCYTTLESTHAAPYQQTQIYHKHCMGVLTSGTTSLEDILCNDTARVQLSDYMAAEGAESLVQFWLISQNYNEQLRAMSSGKPTLSDEQAKEDAEALFGRYFPADAPEALGVDEFTRQETHQNIFVKEGRPQNPFMRSQHLTYTAMRRYFFPEFVKSDFYYQYLGGMTAAAGEVAEAPGAGKQEGAGGKTGTTHEGGAKAGEGAAVAGGETSGDGSEGRSMRRMTSLGTVDEWGIYHKDEDLQNPLFADSVVKVKSGMGQSMKGALGMKKKDVKAEQEAALQVSQMIIKDVYKMMREKSTMFEPQKMVPGTPERKSAVMSGNAWLAGGE
jgi:hypothetical protein